MKNIIHFPVIVTAVVIIVFATSCSTQKNNDFRARKYYGFPRSDGKVMQNKNETIENDKKVVIAKRASEKIPQKSTISEIKINSFSGRGGVNIEKSRAVTRTSTSIPKWGQGGLKRILDNNIQMVVEKNRFSPIVKKEMSDTSTPWVALIAVLCIVIPPLAVYLKQDRIDTWFWVTLILCLASTASFFFSIFGSVLWLAAITIAFLVLFELLK